VDKLKQFLVSIPSWKAKRKIVVFQSDDWGSIRMPSNTVRSSLEKNRFINTDSPYSYYDTLATEEDLIALFDVLSKFKDDRGKHPSITANCIMANPDFDRIRENNFEEYIYEPLEDTFSKYNNSDALKLWITGMERGLFEPQFHGREHVQVQAWMRRLRADMPGIRDAFDSNVFGVSFKNLGLKKDNFQAAWDIESDEDSHFVNASIQEGMQMFDKLFGFVSQSVIPPSYTWSNSNEKEILETGGRYIQSILLQKAPNSKGKDYRRKFRFTKRARHNDLGYIQRNVFFEPALDKNKDWVDVCLHRIEKVFKYNNAVVIGTHRLNFTGQLDESNRNRNLSSLEQLLTGIRNMFPELVFMTTTELISEIEKDN